MLLTIKCVSYYKLSIINQGTDDTKDCPVHCTDATQVTYFNFFFSAGHRAEYMTTR